MENKHRFKSQFSLQHGLRHLTAGNLGVSLSPRKEDPEVFLHVAGPVDVVGLRRGRLTVNWHGQSRLAREEGRAPWGWGHEHIPRSLSFPWDAIV